MPNDWAWPKWPAAKAGPCSMLSSYTGELGSPAFFYGILNTMAIWGYSSLNGSHQWPCSPQLCLLGLPVTTLPIATRWSSPPTLSCLSCLLWVLGCASGPPCNQGYLPLTAVWPHRSCSLPIFPCSHWPPPLIWQWSESVWGSYVQDKRAPRRMLCAGQVCPKKAQRKVFAFLPNDPEKEREREDCQWVGHSRQI